MNRNTALFVSDQGRCPTLDSNQARYDAFLLIQGVATTLETLSEVLAHWEPTP